MRVLGETFSSDMGSFGNFKIRGRRSARCPFGWSVLAVYLGEALRRRPGLVDERTQMRTVSALVPSIDFERVCRENDVLPATSDACAVPLVSVRRAEPTVAASTCHHAPPRLDLLIDACLARCLKLRSRPVSRRIRRSVSIASAY